MDGDRKGLAGRLLMEEGYQGCEGSPGEGREELVGPSPYRHRHGVHGAAEDHAFLESDREGRLRER